MNIVFLITAPFPIGMAGTNRIISLSKSLMLQNNNVKVLCIRPTEKNTKIINKDIEGYHEDIYFNYTSNTVIWPKHKMKKFYVYAKGIINSGIMIIKYKKLNKLDLIILSQSSFIIALFYFIVCKIYHIPYIYAIDEYPWVVLRPENYNFFYRKIYIKYFYKLFDGMLIMTKTLMNYYKDKVRKNCKLLLVPMTVDTEKFFNNQNIIKNKEEYIAYCGCLGHNNKDGVPILIEAFSKIKPFYPQLKLYIIGDTREKENIDFIKIKEQVKKLKLEDDVVFTGRLPHYKIPELLSNAKILALARPNNLQAQGGFPTKLGEYLATGKPVIVTKVGEIPNYLIDGVNACIAEPDSIDDFAKKLKEVLDDYDRALIIGKEGQKTANKYFDYKTQSKNIHLFLSSFIH